MALSRLAAAVGYWLGHVGAPAIQTNIVDPVNAVVDAVNAIQHGTVTVTVTSSADGTQDVTFATAFTSTPTIVATGSTLTANRDFGAQITAKSTTGFTIRAHHWDGTSTSTSVNFDWVAVAL